MKSFLRWIIYGAIAVGLVYYIKPQFIAKVTTNPQFEDVILVLGALLCFLLLQIVLP